MTWITLTLIASFFFAVENLFDKRISDKTENTTSALFFMNIVKIPALILLGVYWFPLFIFDANILAWSLLVGIISAVTGFLYMKAFQYGDASSVIPIYELGPLWAIFFGFIILGELPHSWQYLALFLLICGGLIFSVERSFFQSFSRKKFLNIALFVVLLASFGYNLQYVLTKFVIIRSNLETAFFLQQCFYIGFALIFSLWKSRGAAWCETCRMSRKFIFGWILAEGVGIWAFVLYTMAFTQGNVSLVNAIASTQTLFVIFLSWGMSVFVPSFFHEKWSRSDAVQKIIGTIFIVAWVVCIYFFS